MVNLSLQHDKDHLAHRMAHQFNVLGPAISVQTACSSSLTAGPAAAWVTDLRMVPWSRTQAIRDRLTWGRRALSSVGESALWCSSRCRTPSPTETAFTP